VNLKSEIEEELTRGIWRWIMSTYAAAASEDDEERLEPAGSSDDPDETNEQNDTEDVLDAREIDAEHRAQFLTRYTSIVPRKRMQRNKKSYTA